MSQKSSRAHLFTDSYNIFGISNTDKDFSEEKSTEITEWVFEGPVYELFVRSFSESGDFKGVTEKLDYLADLGIKTIWLLPIHPIGKKKRKGSHGSPYAIKDFLKINSEFGSETELRELITAVHERSMRIILDFVPNHAAYDFILPELLDNSNPRRHPDWTDICDLNIGLDQTRKMLSDAAKYWLKEYDIDGYRCDSAGLMPPEFWKDLLRELKAIKNDAFFLAEWEDPVLHINNFHATYDWTFYYLIKDIFLNKKPASLLMEWINHKINLYPQNAGIMRFIENHDLKRIMHIMQNHRVFGLILLLFTLPGLVLIQAGQEIGLDKRQSIFENEKIDWIQIKYEIFEFYKKCIRLRWENSYSRADFVSIKNNQPEQIISYGLRHDKYSVVIINTTGNEINLRLKSNQIKKSNYINLMNESQILSHGDIENLKVKPYGYYLFKEE